MRDIDDILHFRSDISPFIIHLTKGDNAKDSLKQILRGSALRQSGNAVSDLRFAIRTTDMDPADIERYFGAICLTETPINEIHSLIDIMYRSINLQPYGLVFVKDRMSGKGVSPAIYINNELGDKAGVLRALCSLMQTSPGEALEILPLVNIYGMKVTPPGAHAAAGNVDFRWEREWRYPFTKGSLRFNLDDVFVGLCPNGEIDEFETEFPGFQFVDPLRNLKWYATKLIQARQRLDFKYSVV